MDLPRRGAAARDTGLPLPPGRMPLLRARRPLKRWRYIGVYAPEVMLCGADIRIGPLRQRWWAAALPDGKLFGATSSFRSAGMRIDGPRLRVDHRDASVDVIVEEEPGREVLHPSGECGYVWTRKQAGIPARGRVRLDGRELELDAEAVIDDTAGYHERHTSWRWSAGVGRGEGGERVAWNLVTGVNDSPSESERAIWVDGSEQEPAPVRFADDLSGIEFAEGGALEFSEWSAREEDTNFGLVRSAYRQPFGTFSGELPGGLRLAQGQGVMEWHDVRW